MAPDKKSSVSSMSSMASLAIDRKDSTRTRPHSSNPSNRKEKEPTESISSLSALGALSLDPGRLSRDNSVKAKPIKEHMRKPKMDVARASGIMGFSSGRWLDKSTMLIKLSLEGYFAERSKAKRIIITLIVNIKLLLCNYCYVFLCIKR